MLRESVGNKRAEARGYKLEPKVRGHSGSLKENSLSFLHFFLLYGFFFFFFSFLLLEKKKMLKESV